MECAMCRKEFGAENLDFLGRCEACFRSYLEMKPWERPNLGVPFSRKIDYNTPG